MHARQLCSLALTQFLLNLWVFHYECMECNLNQECQRGTFPVHVTLWCHFAASFRLKWVAICSSVTSSVEWDCCLCFTGKAWSQRLLFVWSDHLWSHWSVKQERCSSLEWVFTLKIILLCHHNDNNYVDDFTAGFTYVKRSLWFFGYRCVQNYIPAVEPVRHFGFPMKYQHSFATVNHWTTLFTMKYIVKCILTSLAQNTVLSQWNHG